MLKKLAAVLALALLPLTAAMVVDSPGAYAGTDHMNLASKLTNLQLSVRGSSTGAGMTLEMRNADTWCGFGWCVSPDQDWELPANGTVNNAMGYIKNSNSGMCLETDGLAGDALYQWPCNGYSLGQVWKISYITNWLGQETYARIINPATQLAIDVAGSDRSIGARVIGWPLNGDGTANQLWSIQYTKIGY